MYQGLAFDIANIMVEAVASGLFTSTCTIQEPAGTFNDAGAPTGDYTPVSGMSNILCMDAPMNIETPSAGEDKSINQQLSTQPRHILLSAAYPAIAEHGDWQAVITEATGEVLVYDILGAETDSQATQTRISGRLASV